MMVFTFVVTYALGFFTGMLALVGLILVVDWKHVAEVKKEREQVKRW